MCQGQRNGRTGPLWTHPLYPPHTGHGQDMLMWRSLSHIHRLCICRPLRTGAPRLPGWPPPRSFRKPRMCESQGRLYRRWPLCLPPIHPRCALLPERSPALWFRRRCMCVSRIPRFRSPALRLRSSLSMCVFRSRPVCWSRSFRIRNMCVFPGRHFRSLPPFQRSTRPSCALWREPSPFQIDRTLCMCAPQDRCFHRLAAQ